MKKIHHPTTQKKITNFRTEEQLKSLIITLESNRWKYYQEFYETLIKLEFEHKAQMKSDAYRIPNVRLKQDQQYDIDRKNVVNDYKEKVNPIDKELHELRKEIIERFNRTEQKKIDKRLK